MDALFSDAGEAVCFLVIAVYVGGASAVALVNGIRRLTMGSPPPHSEQKPHAHLPSVAEESDREDTAVHDSGYSSDSLTAASPEVGFVSEIWNVTT